MESIYHWAWYMSEVRNKSSGIIVSAGGTWSLLPLRSDASE